MKTAIAIRHVHFEDLGTFRDVLETAGYRVSYLDVDSGALQDFDAPAPDLLVVLGGPLGVYQTEAYPFLADEVRILKERIAANRPTLGICLGSQLMATAMGAKVGPSGHSEIGFSKLSLNAAGQASPLRHFENIEVLHWHGDTFALPAGAVLLASTELCRHQAFAHGPNILALQFHPEPDAADLGRWLIGYAGDLGGRDPCAFREGAARFCPPMQGASAKMLGDWLANLQA
jgi:GMP synthase (glutamine-hydrolysing)